jgi:hypothetical protein
VRYPPSRQLLLAGNACQLENCCIRASITDVIARLRKTPAGVATSGHDFAQLADFNLLPQRTITLLFGNV